MAKTVRFPFIPKRTKKGKKIKKYKLRWNLTSIHSVKRRGLSAVLPEIRAILFTPASGGGRSFTLKQNLTP